MPFKDKNKRNEYAREWYFKNSVKHKKLVRIFQKERKIKYRKKLLELYGNKCFDCGFSDIKLLEWHHKHFEKGKPDNYISRLLIRGYGWNKILEESKKCILLCPNCHKYRHLKSKEILT